MEDLNEVKIILDSNLLEKVLERIKKTEFTNLSDYIAFILRQIVDEKIEKNQYNDESEKTVKQKLKSLGYLD